MPRKINQNGRIENWLSIFSAVWEKECPLTGSFMKNIIIGAIVITGCISTGCVRRTTSVEPKYSNPKAAARAAEQGTVLGQKTVWFWQDEYRNP
jgi:hypothetical protein